MLLIGKQFTEVERPGQGHTAGSGKAGEHLPGTSVALIWQKPVSSELSDHNTHKILTSRFFFSSSFLLKPVGA